MTVICPYRALSQGQHLTLCSLKLGLHFTEVLSAKVLLGPKNWAFVGEWIARGEKRLASCFLAVPGVTLTVSLHPTTSNWSRTPAF